MVHASDPPPASRPWCPWLVGSLGGLALLLGSASASGHPGLYFDASELELLRARAADTTTNALGYDFASVFAAIRAQADGFVATPYSYTVQIPDPDGQGAVTWSYDFSAAMPPGHPSNPSYPPWTAVSRGLQARLETLSFVYAITSDESYLRNAQSTGAIDMALALAQWSQWTDPGYGCGGETCLDTAHLTMGIALAYDLGYATLSEAERTTLRTALVDKGLEPLASDVSAGSMSAWFNGYALRVTGLGVGACAVSEELGAAADDWLTLTSDSILAFFASQGADGGAFEGQLYGSYAVNSLMVAAHCLAEQGLGAAVMADPWLATVPRFAAAFLGTGNRLQANFGDSSLAAYWVPTAFALAAQGDGTAQWYLSLTGSAKPAGFLAFIWARPELEPEPIPDSGTSLFADVGHAALRAGFDGAPVVAVKSGPPSEEVGHNHLDHNSVIVSAYDEWIASDPGYESYFNASEHEYTTGSVGHNTVLVDKSVSSDGAIVSGGQEFRSGGQLEYLFDGAGYAKVVAHAAGSYPAGLLQRFDRRVLYAKPDLVLVFDDVGAASAHQYSFLLHTGPGNGVEPAAGPGEVLLTGKSARLQAFVVANAAWASGYPRRVDHPGASAYGPYAEWRSASAPTVQFSAALVPGRSSHVELDNPGFEEGLTSWQPRYDDGSHAVDDSVAHGGSASARISFGSAGSGYYYSEPMSLLPGATLTAAVYVRAETATGTLSVQPYYMKDGSYIAEPGGESATLDAASATDWTPIALTTEAPASGVDAVRIALGFTGSGTIWFDDASYAVTDVEPATPLSTAVALGEPPVGLVVQGPFGVEIAVSLMGTGQSGLVTLEPASDEIAEVPSVSADGSMFAVGYDPEGALVRAFLQGGTVLRVGDALVLGAAELASFDVGLTRDESGCVTLRATEVATLEAPPYTVGALADEVWLGGERVPFTVQDGSVLFPDGDDLGTTCGTAGAGGAGTGGAGASATGGASVGGAAAVPGSADADDGCGCRVVGPRSRWNAPSLVLALVALGVVGLRRRHRRGEPTHRGPEGTHSPSSHRSPWPQSSPTRHSTHCPSSSQRGSASSRQSPLSSQATHSLRTVQIGIASGQSVGTMHSTQACRSSRQTGLTSLQSSFDEQPGRHSWSRHSGSLAGQSPSTRHSRQRPDCTSQVG